jgi:hypothetical protein
LEMKKRFIQEVIDEKIIIYRQKKEMIIKSLYENKYYQMIDKNVIREPNEDVNNGYDYLIKMSIYLFTEEEIEKLEKEYSEKREMHDILKVLTIEEIWLEECNGFIKRYKKVSK